MSRLWTYQSLQRNIKIMRQIKSASWVLSIYLKTAAECNAANSVIIVIIRISASRYRIRLTRHNIIILNRNIQPLCTPFRSLGRSGSSVNKLSAEMIGIFINFSSLLVLVACVVNPPSQWCTFLILADTIAFSDGASQLVCRDHFLYPLSS